LTIAFLAEKDPIITASNFLKLRIFTTTTTTTNNNDDNNNNQQQQSTINNNKDNKGFTAPRTL